MVIEKDKGIGIEIRHIQAIKGDVDLSEEWHILEKDATLGVVFSHKWAQRISAGLELLRELSDDMRKTMDEFAGEVVKDFQK